MVDHDIGVKPQCDDEKAGTGRQLAGKANEGGSVFIDQLTSPGRKAFTPSAHPVNEESSVVRAID